MKRIAMLIGAAALFLTGCSSQPVEPTYYLLRPAEEPTSRALNPSPDFALGKVTIAPYLDQPGMLLETTSGEIRPARQHLWAEPMFEAVHAYLVKEISRLKGQDVLPARVQRNAIIVDVRVDQLHGTEDGKAKLVAYWWLRRNGELLSAYQFAETLPLTRDGYGAMAQAEEELLTQLAEKIAQSMVVPG